ncbi:MAG TPA: NUDIX domain-containing protein [Candidatus Saccharimonadales bacterium]|nr:NUDIX domain-containing protein [Candidatus Saccharimonadales bacterium]
MEFTKEQQLIQTGEELRKEYKEVIVDFIIFDESTDSILVQKRAPTRHMFPDAWEFPGGHLEPNENLGSCLKRLVYEEAEMHLTDIVDIIHIFTWDSDKDVVNLQCLVRADGTFNPNPDKITEHRFIGETESGLLIEKDQDSPIYRGAFYAFEYIKQLKTGSVEGFESVLFFDQLVTSFFTFLRIEEAAPRVVLGREQDKKFTLDKNAGMLSIAPSFLRHYDKFGCASIIMHLIFHNYRQNILAYDDVKAIRSLMGKNIMFYVDIVADAYTFLFLERFYGFTQQEYLSLCHRLLKEYQAETADASKLTRLLGTALTIQHRQGQGFDVYVPVLDEQNSRLHAIRFDKRLAYQSTDLDKALKRKLLDIASKPDVSEKDFMQAIEKIVTLVKAGE